MKYNQIIRSLSFGIFSMSLFFLGSLIMIGHLIEKSYFYLSFILIALSLMVSGHIFLSFLREEEEENG